MEGTDFLAKVKDVFSVSRVFGEPIERENVTVLPMAYIFGGGGGGGDDKGSGGGFGVVAVPAGVYVIRGGEVRYLPPLDPAFMAGVGALLVVSRLFRRKRKKRR